MVYLLRKDVERHTKEDSPKRQYECPHCQEAGEYWERMTKHLNECPMMEVPCPKRRCKVHIARRSLTEHRRECQYEKVPCKYVTIGCKEEVLRKDLEEHEEDSEQHLQLAIDTVHQQQATIREQQTTLQEQENLLAHLRSKEMPMLYNLTSYDRHKTADDEVYSPAFYTSPGGYKMCLGVYANGNGEGKGTCVSVGVHLMKGENDDHLPWPFTGKVTVELLNQLEDNNHYCKIMAFYPDKEVSERVVDEERSSKGWGMPRYISHSALGYNAVKNCQYLKDDCLYFKISVDAKKSSKAWLI